MTTTKTTPLPEERLTEMERLAAWAYRAAAWSGYDVQTLAEALGAAATEIRRLRALSSPEDAREKALRDAIRERDEAIGANLLNRNAVRLQKELRRCGCNEHHLCERCRVEGHRCGEAGEFCDDEAHSAVMCSCGSAAWVVYGGEDGHRLVCARCALARPHALPSVGLEAAAKICDDTLGDGFEAGRRIRALLASPSRSPETTPTDPDARVKKGFRIGIAAAAKSVESLDDRDAPMDAYSIGGVADQIRALAPETTEGPAAEVGIDLAQAAAEGYEAGVRDALRGDAPAELVAALSQPAPSGEGTAAADDLCDECNGEGGFVLPFGPGHWKPCPKCRPAPASDESREAVKDDGTCDDGACEVCEPARRAREGER